MVQTMTSALLRGRMLLVPEDFNKIVASMLPSVPLVQCLAEGKHHKSRSKFPSHRRPRIKTKRDKSRQRTRETKTQRKKSKGRHKTKRDKTIRDTDERRPTNGGKRQRAAPRKRGEDKERRRQSEKTGPRRRQKERDQGPRTAKTKETRAKIQYYELQDLIFDA
jgi:hypothetical protein